MDRNGAVTQPTSCGSNSLLVVEDNNAQSTAITHKSTNNESSDDLQQINEEQRPSHRFGGLHRHHSTSSRRRRRRSFDSSVHPTTTTLIRHDSQLHSTSSTNTLRTHYHTHRQSSIRSLQRRPSFESCTTNNNNESSSSIDIMDFGISSRQLSLYSSFDDTMMSYGGGSWEGEVDSKGFLGWVGRSSDNNTDIGSNRRGTSRGLSNRTILLNEEGKMSERSLSVNSLSTDTSQEELNNHPHGYSYSSSGRRGVMRRGGRQESVKTLDSNLEDELVVEVDFNEEEEDEECLVADLLVVSATKRGLHDQVDRHSSTRAVVHAMNNSDDYCSEASSSTVGVTTRGLQDERYSSTRAILMGANNSDDHFYSEDSSSTLEVKRPRRLQEDKYSSTRAVIHATNGDDQCSAASSSTVGLNPRGAQNDRHSSTRAVLLGASNDNDEDENEDISISTQPIQLSTAKEDGRMACTREESIRTLDGNESVYSIDSKGFMAWKNKSQEVVHKEESMGTALDSGVQTALNGEEESVTTDCNSKLVENEDDGEEEKGALLVDWDQSNKTDQNSVNGCDGESQVCLVKDEPEDNAADATPPTLESSEVTSNVTNDTPSDFNPTRIKSHPDDNFGNRLTRRMRHVSNRLSSSLTSLRSSSTKAHEETRELANSLPLDLSDSILERDGGLLVDWDQSEKEKMGALLTLKDSDYYVEEEVLKDGTDTNDIMNPDEDDSDKTLPIEIKQALEAYDNITSGSSSNFQPTQIKVNKPNSNNVGNSLTNHMKHILMSPTRLSSSLTTPSSKRWTQAPPSLHDHQRTKSRNLTVSLPSDREYNHFRRSTISLTKSDHGNTERGGLRYLNPQNKKSIGNSLHSVPAISSSLLCEDEEANRPIRLSREDNVNIEELRRELLNNAAAADHEELRRRRSRRKSGFNMFADDLRRELGGGGDELNRSRKNKFNLFAMY